MKYLPSALLGFSAGFNVEADGNLRHDPACKCKSVPGGGVKVIMSHRTNSSEFEGVYSAYSFSDVVNPE